MSLKVWLPLNGDLHNQGCSNASVINTGATINTTGKIGSCYNFGTSNSYLKFDNMNFIHNFTECSVSLWLKILSWNNSYATYFQFGLGSTPWAHYIFGLLRNGSNSTLCFTISNGSSATNTGCLTPALELNTWYHLTLTYTAGHCKIYVNGIQTNDYSTTIVPNFARITTGTIGAANNLTGYQANCLINDIRIYNHCLSAAEVKEIAQGLVLHYKLDASSEEKITTIPSTNVYSYPTFNTSATGGGWNHWGPSGHSGNYGQNIDKKYIYNKNNTYSHWITENAGTGKYYLLYQSPAFEGGYRSLQVIIKEENSLPITESICYPDWNARNGGALSNKWTSIKFLGDGFYYCCCEGISQDGSNDLIGIHVNSGYKIYVSECYVENDAEICSPIFTYSSNIIQDSSGYSHNGSILNNILISSDTPRYSTSTNLVAGNSAINCGRGGMVTDSITVNLWLKSSAWANPVSCTESGGWNFESSGDYFRFPVFISGVGYKYYQSTHTKAQLCNNQWHMLTGMYDRINGHVKIYVDGELDNDFDAQTHNNIAYANNVLWIGAEASKSQTAFASNGMVGLFSDFRIYCTALSAADIKQLYEVGAKVDDKQNLHTYKFNENNSNIFSSIPWTNSYYAHSSSSSLFSNYNANGEPQFTANGTSAGTNYVTIVPGTYRYDYTISVNAGNQFYIGFERYDENKTSRSNSACVYTYNAKPSSDVIKRRYTGTIDLSTDGTNPIRYVSLRILNGWSGTTSGVIGQATIHNFSLRLVSSISSPKLKKTGELIINELKENTKASFYQDGIVEANNLIEF